jgi:hypothetical protein
MILASIDVETTGLDVQNDRIIEMGLVLYSTGRKKILESTGFLVQSDGVEVTDEITKLTGITQDAADTFGYSQGDAIEIYNDYVSQAGAVIGHNILRFDLPVIQATAKRLGINLVSKLSIDTTTDIPGVKGEQLITMCAKHGFVNPNQHSAEDDAKSVIKLISGYDILAICERAKCPLLPVVSKQDRLGLGRDAGNKVARKQGFRWNGDYKIWWQAVKECDLQEFADQQPFPVHVTDVPLEQLRD